MRLCTFLIIFSLGCNPVFSQALDEPLKISQLAGDFYIFTTYGRYRGNPVPANGMYLVTSSGVVIIDSPWDSTQFQPLLDSIWARHHQPVLLCIATHFHEDRTAGLQFFQGRGIETYTTRRTDELSRQRGTKRARHLIDRDTVFSVGQYSFKTFFPGEGHSSDNIVIWFEKQRILYGGCLIKSVTDKDLGNTSDGNLQSYAQTLRRVKAECMNPWYIIPGHGNWKDSNSLNHTLEMAEKQFKKAPKF